LDLPPINLRSPQFWAFAVICMIVVTVIFSIGGLLRKLREEVASATGKATPVSPKTLLGKLKRREGPLLERCIVILSVVANKVG
jgi:hypothetical protein